MSRVDVLYHGKLSSPLDGGEVESRLDEVMEELLRIESDDKNVSDASVSLSSCDVEIAISVNVLTTPEEATAKGLATIRAAVHAAGGSTPDWPAKGSWTMDWSSTLAQRHELVGA